MSSSDDEEVVKVKRQTYKPKTLDEMSQFLETLKSCIEKMREAMFRNKKDSTFPENAPTQNEFKALKKELDTLLKAYKHACQPKPRTKKDDEEGADEKKASIGFNRVEYIYADMANFINKHPIDDDQPTIDIVTKDGRGLFTRALLTSYWSNYIEKHGLKHPDYKKYIIPDEDMDSLFTDERKKQAENAHKTKLKVSKKKKTTKKVDELFVTLDVTFEGTDDETVTEERDGFDFSTLQMLLTLFVDKAMAVINVDKKQTKNIDNLKSYFTEKTTTIRDEKKRVLKEEKEKEKAKKKKEKEAAKKKGTTKKNLPATKKKPTSKKS
jgi:hypothetical protein